MLTVAVAFIGFVTAALSGIAGIGGGTVLIGVLYALGLPPVTAVPLHAAVQCVSNLSRTIAFLKHVEWRAAGWFLLTAAPTPFLFAPLVAAADVHLIELLLAGLILTSLVPTQEGEPIGPRTAFVLAGLLNGSIGMFVSATGLFVGRLFLRPEWKKETVIATLALTQTLGHLLRVLAYASAGFAVSQRLDLLAPLVVAVIAGTAAGRVLHRRLDERRFRSLFRAILAVLSLKLLYDGAAGLLGA
ncbi:MAG TPA: sulfite exporter TauE/SafE family protein [Candidatus Binatia bacterium]|nr:sulfite exporter TauE/SafE family protein [Candidatus Binatia bacterium]